MHRGRYSICRISTRLDYRSGCARVPRRTAPEAVSDFSEFSSPSVPRPPMSSCRRSFRNFRRAVMRRTLLAIITSALAGGGMSVAHHDEHDKGGPQVKLLSQKDIIEK